MSFRQAILVILATAGFSPVFAQLQVHSSPEDLTILDQNHPVMHYQLRTKSLDGKWRRSNYVHPLYGLSGEVITEDFPEDHRHHRGIFWAWHQINVGGHRLSDQWLCRKFHWETLSRSYTLHSDGSATVSARIHWKSTDYVDDEGTLVPVAQEDVGITVHPKKNNARSIDFDIRVTALVNGLRIGGSENDKGYGGFSPRIRLNRNQRFGARDGEIEPETTAIKAGPWVSIDDEQLGLAILSHPRNPGPNQWILRRQGSMQNVVYPGRKPVGVTRDNPLHLAYRLVIHHGHGGSADIDAIYQDYAAGGAAQ